MADIGDSIKSDKFGDSLMNLSTELGDSLENIEDSFKELSLDNLGESLNHQSVLGRSNSISFIAADNDHQEDFVYSGIDPYDFASCENEHISDIDEYTPKITSTPKKKQNFQKYSHLVDNEDHDDDSNELMHPVNLTDNMCTSFTQEELPNELGMKAISNQLTGAGSTNKLLQKALSTAIFCKIRARKCIKMCLNDTHVDVSFIRSARYRLWTKDFEGRVEWFSDKLAESEDKDGTIIFQGEGGKRVCGKCFRDLYYINKNFYSKYIKKYRNGAIAAGYKQGRSMMTTTEKAITWLENYSLFHGDRMPDRDIIMLPYKSRKIDVYTLYKNDQVEDMEDFISRSNFYSIWKTKFDYLKIKQTNSFSKCGVCTMLERQLEGTRDPAERKHIKKLILAHQRHQMEERKYYYEKRNKAVKDKEQYMSLIIDGMDQVKTNLPHFTGRSSKSLDMQFLLHTHIQGVMNHGLQRFAKYVDINEYCHDSNMVMNTLLKEIYETNLHMGNRLPPVLFLQADNCYRENKNRFMLGFCEMLVLKKIFKEVHLSFLFVGHTHEDIDAGFSQISEVLRRNDAPTLPRLFELIPTSKRLHGVFDIKTWITPYINKISNHTQPHHFKFSQDINGKICSEFKGSCRKPWSKFSYNILHKIPQGIPDLVVPPNFSKINIEGLTKNIERSRFLFTDTKDESQFKWWKKYITTLSGLKSSASKRQQYAELHGTWLLPLLPVQKTAVPNKKNPVIIEHLTEIVDREVDEPEVIVIHSAATQNRGKRRGLGGGLGRDRGLRRGRGHGRGRGIGRGRGLGRGQGLGRGRGQTRKRCLLQQNEMQ